MLVSQYYIFAMKKKAHHVVVGRREKSLLLVTPDLSCIHTSIIIIGGRRQKKEKENCEDKGVGGGWAKEKGKTSDRHMPHLSDSAGRYTPRLLEHRTERQRTNILTPYMKGRRQGGVIGCRFRWVRVMCERGSGLFVEGDRDVCGKVVCV